MSVGWVIDIPRDLEPPVSTVTIDYLESPLTPDGLIGLGLGGYEVGFPAAPYTEHFARGRALGLHSLPHAGETEGADSVRQAVDDLGAERVGHGVRVLEDAELVAQLRDSDVFCEVCPTSNLLLGVVDSLDEHPLPRMLDAGLRVCLNTDDPGWFDTDLMTELQIGSDLGLSLDDHVRLQRDAVRASCAPVDVKRLVGEQLDAFERARC